MRPLIAVLMLLGGICVPARAETLKVPPECQPAGSAKPVAGGYADRIVHATTGMEMLFIPAGHVRMGLNDPNPRTRRPWRDVVVSKPFYIGMTEVTNAQYRAFLAGSEYDGASDADPSYDLYLRHFRGKSAMSTKDDFPVVWVSWKNAKAFCKWAGLALPSEAQWEYACRAGTTTAYYYGDDPKDCDKYAWVISSKEYHTHAVAQKIPNSWNLHDMIGNVWEWTEDDFIESFEGAPEDETPRLAGRMTKVLKGGCWGSGVRYYINGSGGRYNLSAMNAAGGIGFRAILAFDAPEDICLAPIDRGLVARYTFEEGESETVRDTSGFGNHGKNSGAKYVKFGSGEGSAISFDAPEASVDCGSDAALNLGSALTMEFWLFAKTKPAKGEVGIIGKDFNSYLMSFGGRFWYYINGGKNHCVTEVPLGEWHHIAATYDRKVMKLYLDGKMVSERTLGHPIAKGENFYLRPPLHGDANVEGGCAFMLDDVRVYNRALSREEILARYREDTEKKQRR